jgi:hypothetical protein
MRLLIGALVVLALAVATGVILVTSGDDRRAGALAPTGPSSQTWSLQADGISMGPITNVSCGFAEGDVATTALGPDTAAQKHVTTLMFRPCSFRVGLTTMTRGFYDWLNAAISGQTGRKNLTLNRAGSTGTSTGALELMNAHIDAASLSPLDAKAGAAAPYFEVTVIAEQMRRLEPDGSKAAVPTSKTPVAANFKLTLDGVAIDEAAKIEAWSFTVHEPQEPVGVSSEPTKAPPVLRLNDLKIELTEGSAGKGLAEVDALLKKSLLDHVDLEKTATIEFRDATLTRIVAEVRFTGVGIDGGHLLGLGEGDAAPKRSYSFYVEGAQMTASAG